MKKLWLLTIIAVLALCCTLLLAACGGETGESGTKGLAYTLINNDTQYAVSIGEATDASVTIPAEYNGLPVTEIASQGFMSCVTMTNITIPDSVLKIGDSAFYNCTNLTCITLFDSVTEFGARAFRNCTSLTDIEIPGSVKTLGEEAFYKCSDLSSITIPNSVTQIKARLLYGCESLESMSIPFVGEKSSGASNAILGYFFGATDYYYQVDTLPTRLTTIEISSSNIPSNAFYRCGKLTQITMTGNVKTIGSGAFYGCYGLTSIVLPDSVTSIERYAFFHCNGLATFEMTNKITSIGESAFEECSKLISVTIPDSVKDIGSSAFRSCSSLTSFTIGSGLTDFEAKSVFYASNALATIDVVGTNTSFSSLNGILYNKNKTSLLYCPRAKTGSISLPSGLTTIDDSAFYGCSKIKEVTLPNTLTTINTSAFAECTGITSLTIPSGVTYIHYAFSLWSSSQTIRIQTHTSEPDGWHYNWTGTNCKAKIEWGV